MPLPVSGFFVALHALLLLALSIRIIQIRLKVKVAVGTSVGDKPYGPLARAVRVQGNFIEYVPLALLMLSLLELFGVSIDVLFGLGGLLFVARVSHAIGLSKTIKPSIYRAFGVIGTYLVLLIEAIYLIWLFLTGLFA